MNTMTIQQAFEVAVNDGINIYVREALLGRGLLTSEKVDELARAELLELKYKIAREIARDWAAMKLEVRFVSRLDESLRPLDGGPDDHHDH